MRSNSNTYDYANGITDGNSNAECNGDVYSYTNSHIHANANAFGYCRSNIYSNGHGYGYCHSNSDLHAYGNSDSNIYSDGYGHGYSYGHTNSGTNTCGSNSPKRKPRDWQQLHRELDQCKRGDRLPVGCGYGLFFCKLCARLPKFGCRQCH
jgi:hypothetical protein